MKLNVGRYSVLLQRLFNLRELDTVADISPEISPVMVLESDRPEWKFLAGERLISAATSIAGVAAQNSIFRLRNPANSGVLAILERVRFSAEPTTDVAYDGITTLGSAATDLATVVAAVSRDSRSPVNSALIASVTNNVAASGSTIDSWSGRWGAQLEGVVPIVLYPGSSMDLRSTTVQLTMFCMWQWREREIGNYERP